VEIREFAERILFGRSLEEKLIKPDELTDRLPGRGIDVPDAPGRPRALEFPRGRKHKKIPFPGVHELDKPRVRGHVLHFFANHELLAMELMALLLLRFPEAPESFRRGIVETILEEQKHMRLYAERMEIAGVEFGEIPVNEYFWTVLRDIRSPLEFVTGMSMTLEQANLDYSGYYRKAFRAIRDFDTADVLDIVYREEIGHVKHGVVWFDRWRPPGSDRFETWMDNLPERLPPVRAKGIGFDEESRLVAGLDEAYVRQLRVLGGSKGRPPNVYAFVPWTEMEIENIGRYSPPTFLEHLRSDFETLPMFLGASDDVVLTRRKPDPGFLTQLRQIGYQIPEFAAGDTLEDAVESLEYDRIGAFVPWGWSGTTRRLSEQIDASRVEEPPTVDDETHAAFHSKSYWTDLREEFLVDESDERLTAPASRLVIENGDLSELSAFLDTFGPPLCFSSDFGTAGRGSVRVLDEERASEVAESWKRRGVSGIVEPLRDRVCDFSWQFEIKRDGSVQHHGMLRTLVDRRGQFRGAILNRFAAGLPTEVLRFIYDDGHDTRWLRNAMRVFAELVAERLRESGYRGLVGVDGYMYRTSDGELRVEPCSEVNPRMTMGRIALGVAEGVASSTTPVWLLLHHNQVENRFGDIDSLYDLLHDVAPREFTSQGRAGNALSRGAFFTSDPTVSQTMLSLAVVGRTDDDALAMLEHVDPELSDIAHGRGLSWSD
jgi:uncharacterized ferritin-like protein (DUF455 family)